MIKENPSIVIYGAGAIGASICAWLTPHIDKLYILARGETAKVLKANGLGIYQAGNEIGRASCRERV